MRVTSSPRVIGREELALETPYEPPASELEILLSKLFSEVLEVHPVGANDDFFRLGGESLQAESLCLAIAEQAGIHVRTSSLVGHGTPRRLANFLLSAGTSGDFRQPAAAQTGRPPIFLVHGRLGLTLLKPPFLAGLAPGQEVHVFELPGLRGDGPVHDSIEEIASDYLLELCRRYPQGPVLLAAFCRGALIALEMTRQLERMGRPVQQLVLFDPSLPPATVRCLSRNFGGSVASDGGRRRIGKRLEEQLRCFRHFVLVGRWTDGTQEEDFADERLRSLHARSMKRRLWLARLKGEVRYHPGIRISWEARAKLLSAYRHYLPRPFDGPTCILASKTRYANFADGSVAEARIWRGLFPRLEVRDVGVTHADLLGANSSQSARLAQEIFDARSGPS